MTKTPPPPILSGGRQAVQEWRPHRLLLVQGAMNALTRLDLLCWGVCQL